ncbi:MAG: ThiF family adenylyltransferase [Bacteroidia bacterium]
MSLSPQENERYARHLILPKFGETAQLMLKNAKAIVVGSGGLGTPALQYLTAAGVGTIGLIEFDSIEISNLQRQVLFRELDKGKKKGEVAIEFLQAQNPNVAFKWHDNKLTSENALDIIAKYDVIIDGSDNFPTRYLVNDACVLLNKPFIYGSIHQFEGQVSVFNYNDGANYRDVFPTPPAPELAPNCAQGGVIGALPGIIGSMQALEAIKVITGIGSTLKNKIFAFNALDFKSHTIKIHKDPENPISGKKPTIKNLIDYELFCNSDNQNQNTMINEINVAELKQWMDSGKEFTLIDVRENYEYEAANIKGELIPLGEIEAKKAVIPNDKDVVIMCRSGVRSANAIQLLQIKYSYNNLFNLKGGIKAWANEIDTKMHVI